MLVRLLYASTAHPSVDGNEYRKILLTAQTKNNEASVSGMLVFNQKYFLQVLEGDRSVLNALYNKIAKDPRHHSLEILGIEEIATRDYGTWSMGYAAPTTLNRSLFMKYGSTADFNPYKMGVSASLAMMKELAGQTVALKVKEQENAAANKPSLLSRIVGSKPTVDDTAPLS